jgi:hypothetical protein
MSASLHVAELGVGTQRRTESLALQAVRLTDRGERGTIFEAIPGEERLGDVDLPAGSSVNG